MNQTPTSLKAIGDPHPGWRSFQTHQPANPIHTPQDPAEDVPRIGITRKLNVIKIFFLFSFLQMASRDLLEFQGGGGTS